MIILVDAFVALGGNLDKTGFVKKSNLLDTMKNEFEIALDIEAMIDGVSGDLLDY